MHNALFCGSLVAGVAALLAVAPEIAAAKESLDPERVKAVAAMLAERPAGLGSPIGDRAAWERLADTYKKQIPKAAEIMAQPLPDQPDDLFLDFSKTGTRVNWERVAGKRRGRLTPLVLAECVENKGRFLPAIEQLVEALCAEKTWVMPAHDRDLSNFKGTAVDIDLASSALAWNLATADSLLGEKLKPPIRQTLRENVGRRVLEPFRAMYNGERKPNWWMLGTNNWNAVCLACTVGAGLAQVEQKEQRAQFIVAAEKYSRNFLAGFTPDGYCSEGLGYWNYGFGHYLMLAETVRQATRGGVDLLSLPDAKAPASFGARIQIIGGVAPAFADCGVKAKPAEDTMYFLNRRFSLGLKAYEPLDLLSVVGSLFQAMLYAFPNAVTEMKPAAEGAPRAAGGPELRTWFDKAGILICRPAPDSPCRMGVALKGGHNAENHNHNDVGSFVVVVGDKPVLLDPGAETYTARTFSNKRYDSKLLNSFGHPVPVIAGRLQREGREAQGKVLRTDFTDNADTVQFDISSAYPVPELKTLERTFVFSREKAGSVTVTDRVEFKNPQTFGTALLTLGKWEQLPDRSLIVRDDKAAVKVEVDAGGAEWTVQAEEIQENAPVKPTRLGINLSKPVTAATVTLKITPQGVP
ncbi:MAG: heparinase II/III family protein [Planctomycetota bacterium]|nr:heparinase II/III family protein [Planctomycetota bacterium]